MNHVHLTEREARDCLSLELKTIDLLFGGVELTGKSVYVDPIGELEENIQSVYDELNGTRENINARGIIMPLDYISHTFQLNKLERDLLLLAVGVVMDQKIAHQVRSTDHEAPPLAVTWKVYNHVFGATVDDSMSLHRALSRTGPLLSNSLLLNINNYTYRRTTGDYEINPRLLEFLNGFGSIKNELSQLLSPSQFHGLLQDLPLTDDKKTELHALSGRLEFLNNANETFLLVFQGENGTGRRDTANTIFRKIGFNLLELDLGTLLFDRTHEYRTILSDIILECQLLNAGLAISVGEILEDPSIEMDVVLRTLYRILPEVPGGVVIYSGKKIRLPQFLIESFHHNLFEIDFPAPDHRFRARLWSTYLNDFDIPDPSLNARILADRYHFTHTQIRNVAHLARNRSAIQGEATIEILLDGCRAESRHNLSRLARKIEKHFTWEDLILPEDHIDRLKELSLHLKHRETVYDTIGFASHGTAGRGLNVLFTGPSGTGKTMAASIIAGETGLELYRIDLATVVSKYIGDTEKNLSRIFHEAKNSNAILFFDEADALFGKRSEVKDARDRYANVEVAYLLQKMEEYEGMTILATNLGGNMDDAFRRRLHFIINFPPPDKPTSKRLWMAAFPPNAPLADDIDYDFLGNEIEFTGGNIKSTALNAAFFAAEDAEKENTEIRISMKHIIQSVRREYQKLGRPFSRNYFKKYYDLAMGEKTEEQ